MIESAAHMTRMLHGMFNKILIWQYCMTGGHCLYSLLGVGRGANLKEIKGRYYKLCREHHPDTCDVEKTDAAMFGLITDAYRVLSDGKLRRQYDESVDRKISNKTIFKDNYTTENQAADDNWAHFADYEGWEGRWTRLGRRTNGESTRTNRIYRDAINSDKMQLHRTNLKIVGIVFASLVLALLNGR